MSINEIERSRQIMSFGVQSDMNTICPKCKSEDQIKQGFTVAKSQRYFCKSCGNKHTPQTKHYSDEQKALAIRTYYSGTSGCAVGKIFGMSHQNVFRWIKKNSGSVDK